MGTVKQQLKIETPTFQEEKLFSLSFMNRKHEKSSLAMTYGCAFFINFLIDVKKIKRPYPKRTYVVSQPIKIRIPFSLYRRSDPLATTQRKSHAKVLSICGFMSLCFNSVQLKLTSDRKMSVIPCIHKIFIFHER